MKEFVFATNNAHKLEEVNSLAGSGIIIRSLKDINFLEDIPETSETIEGNALQKARHIYTKFKCNCFADDTGLEVEALNNRPGVYSARYAGENCSFEDNTNKILEELEGIKERTARFRTVIALIYNDKEYIFEGIANGVITEKKMGCKGFGYDPVFQPTGTNLTFAEMSANEKNSISHRGIATRKLIDFLSVNKK